MAEKVFFFASIFHSKIKFNFIFLGYVSLNLYKLNFLFKHSVMDKKKFLSVGGKVLFVVAVVLATDFVKQYIAKSNMSKPLEVKSEE